LNNKETAGTGATIFITKQHTQMNRTKLMTLAGALMLGSFAMTATAQTLKVPAPSPQQTLKQGFGLGDITLDYSRPAAKGRVVFGDLVPYGKVWRTGANSTTKITFSDDVQVEGQEVKAGTYGLYTIPGKDSWTVMLYKDLSLAGNVASYNTENEVLRVKVKPVNLSYNVESFTIALGKVMPTSATLDISWERTRVPVKITTDIDGKIMKNIDQTINNDNRPYFQAASYYYENGKDLTKALDWANKASDQNPKAFWVKMLKAKIQLKMGDKKAAISTANEVVSLAQEAQNDDYVKLAQKLIADAKK
jgi:hypothetical protein